MAPSDSQAESPGIRPAVRPDIPAIARLIEASARALGSGHYTDAQTEAALGSAFGVDSQLIEDGTYFVVTHGPRLVGCGGWSYRETLFGSDQETHRSAAEIDPTSGAARIRAFFVHPDFARRGIGTQILAHCESEAAKRGFHRLELMSTLPGLKFYQRHGYRPGEPIRHRLPGGVMIDFVPMSKQLETVGPSRPVPDENGQN